MPWVAHPRRRPKPKGLERLLGDRERLVAWGAARLGLALLLAFWFLVARRVA